MKLNIRRAVSWAAAPALAIGVAAAITPAAMAMPAAPAPGVAPGAVTVGTARYVLYTASDGSVSQVQAGTGAPTTSLGGKLLSGPSATSNGTTIFVFGQGTDNQLWTKAGTGAWKPLGGVLTSKPAAVQNGISQAVFARGSDGAVWERSNTAGAAWGPWQKVGGQVLAGTGPGAAADGKGNHILVVGTDHRLYLSSGAAGLFGLVGGRTNASPALTASSAGLIGYVEGTDGALWAANLFPGDGQWTSLGGRLTSGTGATSTAGTPYGYALGTDGNVWQNANLSPTGWTNAMGP